MKKSEVKVGGTYAAKVSGKVVQVRIDAENPHGGWGATNLATQKKVRIKSAQRLRGAVHKSKPMALAIPSQAGAPADEKKAKVEAWRKEVAAKAAKPDPELDKAVEAAEKDRKTRRGKKTKAKGPRKPGCLDLAVKVLAEASKPMTAGEMVDVMLKKNLWQTKGATPGATLYAALIREIAAKGKTARFRRAEVKETKDGKTRALRGYFDLTDAAKKEPAREQQK